MRKRRRSTSYCDLASCSRRSQADLVPDRPQEVKHCDLYATSEKAAGVQDQSLAREGPSDGRLDSPPTVQAFEYHLPIEIDSPSRSWRDRLSKTRGQARQGRGFSAIARENARIENGVGRPGAGARTPPRDSAMNRLATRPSSSAFPGWPPRSCTRWPFRIHPVMGFRAPLAATPLPIVSARLEPSGTTVHC